MIAQINMVNKKILIVEDEGIQAMTTKLTLIRMGYSVLPIAISGKSAVDLAHKYQPDLILMDIRLRGRMDGIEAASIIRKEASTPIIFISAYADETTMQRAEQTHPVAVLEKPIEPQRLGVKIQEALLCT